MEARSNCNARPVLASKMTGVDWLDWAAFAGFLGIAVVLAAQLLRGRALGAHHTPGVTALHVVMALGMAAMSRPGLDPLPAEMWMAVFAGTAVTAVVVCARHAPAHAVHHVVGSLFMVVAFAAGHGAHGAHGEGHVASATHLMVDPTTGELAEMTGQSMHQHAVLGAADRSAFATTIGGFASWPVWPIVGAAFAAYALWLAWELRTVRSPVAVPRARGTSAVALRLPEQACGLVMAAAMAAMAFVL